MNPADIIDVAREAIFVLLKIGAPVMLVALVVGLTVSLVQALTQIQEMTLSFVPKMLIIFLSLLLFLPFMMATMSNFMQRMADRIINLG